MDEERDHQWMAVRVLRTEYESRGRSTWEDAAVSPFHVEGAIRGVTLEGALDTRAWRPTNGWL